MQFVMNATDISGAIRGMGGAQHCPVARVIQRQSGDPSASVRRNRQTGEWHMACRRGVFVLPENAAKFAAAFDARQDKPPVTFDLDLSRPLWYLDAKGDKVTPDYH